MIGDLTPDELQEMDFNDLVGVSWCEDRIGESDIEFTLK